MTVKLDHNSSEPGRIIISVDGMGGDQGPAAIVAGMAKSAYKRADLDFILHGPEEDLSRLVARHKALTNRVRIVDARNVVTMQDKPSHVVRHGRDTSMWSALQSVRSGEAAVAVSCGNTGALMALSMICLRRLPGITRPAIAIFHPSRNPQGYNVLLDVGADIRADSGDLLQYALMGASYARNGMDLRRPRIGLLNVGTEDNKGRQEIKDANDLIARNADKAGFDYVGFVEGGDISGDVADVIVTDGFTGNVAIKTAEGLATFVSAALKEAFSYTPLSRIAALLAYTSLRRMGRRFDPRRSNGGVFLGLNGTVVKSHGSADGTSFSAALKLAVRLAESRFAEKLAARVASADLVTQKDGTANGQDEKDRHQA